MNRRKEEQRLGVCAAIDLGSANVRLLSFFDRLGTRTLESETGLGLFRCFSDSDDLDVLAFFTEGLEPSRFFFEEDLFFERLLAAFTIFIRGPSLSTPNSFSSLSPSSASTSMVISWARNASLYRSMPRPRNHCTTLREPTYGSSIGSWHSYKKEDWITVSPSLVTLYFTKRKFTHTPFPLEEALKSTCEHTARQWRVKKCHQTIKKKSMEGGPKNLSVAQLWVFSTWEFGLTPQNQNTLGLNCDGSAPPFPFPPRAQHWWVWSWVFVVFF